MISAIKSSESFQGFYKIASEYLGDNTADFFAKNYRDLQLSHDNNSRDIFVHVPDDEDIEYQLEESIKKDNGKFWKARPLEFLIDQRGYNIFNAVFKADKGISGGRENWTDYTV